MLQPAAKNTARKVSPGLDLSLKNALLDVSFDYALEAQVDERCRRGKVTHDSV